MNKLKTSILAICSLVLVNTGTAIADSANFAGPYVGVSISGYGISLDGNSRSSGAGTDGQSDDDVPIGATTPVSGIEVGYALPLGSGFLIDIGGQYFTGEAKLDHIGDDSSQATNHKLTNVSFKIDDLKSGYIAPTLVLSDTSSVYVKVGLSEANVIVTGDITTPGDLSGQTWAMGTRTVLDSGIFIRTEAGYTEYNGLSAHGKGTTINTTTSFSAEPTVAYGSVSLGFRF